MIVNKWDRNRFQNLKKKILKKREREREEREEESQWEKKKEEIDMLRSFFFSSSWTQTVFQWRLSRPFNHLQVGEEEREREKERNRKKERERERGEESR